MAYKNSGAMKFNDATDLVIRADPNGTVESVYNRADNTEYIGKYSVLSNVSATISNIKSSAATIYGVSQSGDYIRGFGFNINAGSTTVRTLLKNGLAIISTAGSKWVINSGSAELIDAVTIKVTGDCNLNIEDA